MVGLLTRRKDTDGETDSKQKTFEMAWLRILAGAWIFGAARTVFLLYDHHADIILFLAKAVYFGLNRRKPIEQVSQLGEL